MSKLEIFHNQNVERPWTFQKTVSWVQCAEILSEALHSGKRRCLRNPMELTFPSEIGSNRASMTLPQIYLTIIWSDKWMENFLPNYVTVASESGKSLKTRRVLCLCPVIASHRFCFKPMLNLLRHQFVPKMFDCSKMDNSDIFFLYFHLFNAVDSTYMGKIKFCWWLETNCGPLISEATTLRTRPQPLALKCLNITAQCVVNLNLSWESFCCF